MTTNNQGVGTRELALMILLEIERGEKSHIVLRQVLEKYQYLWYHYTVLVYADGACADQRDNNAFPPER